VTLGEYSFLPWLRRGIVNYLDTPATASSRASLNVVVHLRSDVATADVPPKRIWLKGPKDLGGLVADNVVRTEPREGVTNFEPNYLAYVDFYDEDFAWCYTPDLPDKSQHRLTPWLTLLVLNKGEFKPLQQSGQSLPGIELTAEANLDHILPPSSQLWAWAHVHLNAPLGSSSGAPNLDTLASLLRQNPDLGYCRLMSPRHLEPNTRYQAFVIPTFEVGRAAGLKETIPDNTPGLAIAWATSRTFPSYYSWSFVTGAAGDFEELVRALRPRDIDPAVGIRKMDIQQPGSQLPPTTGQPDDITSLEGVLLAPTSKPIPLDPACNLPAELAAKVNEPADFQVTGAAATGDPLIGVPLYGRWHALVDRVQTFAEHRNWIDELNTDPRYRAVAGIGTKVVQTNQENYMRLAWQQIGDIVTVNRKIHLLQMSAKASEALYAKSLASLSPETALSLAAPVLRKVMGSPVTLHYLVRQSRLPAAALSGAMRKQLRPRGQLMRRAVGRQPGVSPLSDLLPKLNSGAVSAAPPRPAPNGTTYEGSLRAASPPISAWLRWLAKHRDLLLWLALILIAVVAAAAPGAVLTALTLAAAAPAVVAHQRLQALEKQASTVESFARAALTPEAIAALPPNDSFLLPVDDHPIAATAPTGGLDSAQGAAFRTAAIEFNTILSARPAPPPAREPLALAGVHAGLLQALEPRLAFVARHSRTMAVGGLELKSYTAKYHDAAFSVGFEERIIPVMAYPDIKLPMYMPLRDLQKDNFVPNLHLVPPNTISLMLTNPPVIESYMVGLNHEFARELLWREYPTDQRPSTFRQFWDPSSFVDPDGLPPDVLAEKLRDIRKLHEWPFESTLGTHNNRLPNDNKPRVVLIIRGDLLKRYPNTIIYAQTAHWGEPPEHQNHLMLYDETGTKIAADNKDPHFRFPMFRAQVDPDITFIGFDLLLEDVLGDPTLAETEAARQRVQGDRLGWFFVLQEVVGEPRFGMDEDPVSSSEDPLVWDNLSWKNLGEKVSVIDLDKPFASNPPGSDKGGAAWGGHSADMAFILYQKPVMIAIHARDMLKNLKLNA
jgi:hypothetical protein